MENLILGETNTSWRNRYLGETIFGETNIWRNNNWRKIYLEKLIFGETKIGRDKCLKNFIWGKLEKINIWRNKCLKKPCIGYLKKLIFGETNIWWNKYLEKHINVETNILVVSYFWSPDSGVIQISSCWPLYHLVGLLPRLNFEIFRRFVEILTWQTDLHRTFTDIT